MDDTLTCPACGADDLTLTEITPAHRVGAGAAPGLSDAPPPHDVPRTAFFVCERCDSPGEIIISDDWVWPGRP